jgi:hypothetical protein
MSLTVDDGAFQKALEEYAASSSREIPKVLNKVAKDVGFLAAKNAPRALKSEIKKLETLWRSGDLAWVKYISKTMTFSGYGGGEIDPYTSGISKRILKAGGTVDANFRWRNTNGRYAMEARKLSRRLISSRTRAIGFLAHAYVMAARLVDPDSHAALPRGKGKSKAKGWAKPANVGQGDRPAAQLHMAWDVPHRAGALRAATPAMQLAMQQKATDMKVRIMDRIAQLANQHQGKRR